MNMKNFFTNKKVIISLLAVVVVAVGGYYIYARMHKGADEAPFKVPVLNQSYSNAKHHFSLTMPEGFTARESTVDGKDTIVFENAKSEGIQIVISPYDDIKVLTADMIESAIPDMKVEDAESVEIGNANKGLAFKSDNQAFDGKSREVWFVFNRELYQISTYERLDELLQKMFATWSFNGK